MSKPSVSPLLKKVKVKSPKNFFTKSINKQSKKKPRQSDSSSSCSTPTSLNNVNEENKLSSTTSTTVASNKSEHHTPIQSNTTTKELHRNNNDDFPTVPNLLDDDNIQHDQEDDSVAAMSDIRERENSLDQNSWSEMYTNSEYDAYYKLDSIDADVDVDVEISIGVDEMVGEKDELNGSISKTDDDNDTNDDMFIGDIDEEVEDVTDDGDDGGIVEDDSIQWNTPKRGNKSISATDNTIPSSPLPTSSSLNHNTPTNTPRSKVFFPDDDDDTSFNLKTPPNLKVRTTPNNTTASNFRIPTTPMTPLEELHTPGGSTNAPKVLNQNKKLRAGRKELLKVIDATAKQFKAYEEVASKKIFELEERIREMEKERCIDDEKVESNVAADSVGDSDKAAAADTVQDSNETDEKLISSLKLQCETLEYRLNEKEAELEQKRQVWENDVQKLSDVLQKNNDALDYSVTELERLRRWKIELDLREKGSDALSESSECNDVEPSLEEQEKAKEDTRTEFDNESVTDQETDEVSAISEPTQQIEAEESTKDDVNEEEVISDDSANDQEEEVEEELVKVAEDEGEEMLIINDDAETEEEEEDRGSELEGKSSAAGKETEVLLAEKEYQINSLEESLKEKGDEIVQLQRDLDSCFKEIETLKTIVHETSTAKGQEDFQRIIENMQYEAIKSENNATASRERLESELEEKSAEIAQLNEEIKHMCEKQDEDVVDLPVSETDNSDHEQGNNRIEPIDNIRSSLLLATHMNASSPAPSSPGISPTGARRWSTFARKLAKEGRQYAAAVGNANDPESMLGMIRQRDRHISSLEAVIESNTLMIEKLKNDIERMDTEHEEALAQSSKSMRQLEEENEVYLQQVKGFEKAFMTLNESQQTTILPTLDEDVTNTPEESRPDIRADEVGSDEVTSNLESQNRKLERVLAETREENSFQEDIIEKLKTELTTLRVVSQQEKESACDKLRDENKVIEAQKSALEHQLLEINKFARNSLAQDNTSPSNDAGSSQANDIDESGSNPILVAKVAMLENAKKVLESSVDSLRNGQQEKLAPLLERIALLEEEKRIIEEEMATKLHCREQTISNLEESLKQATQSRLANKKKSSALQQSVRLLARASKATSDSGE